MNNIIMVKTATLTISSSNSIPDEIIVFEILKRLPVKSLCRFKSVSKRWLSIISSRPFIDSHFEHSKLNPTRLFIFHNKDTITRHPLIFFSTNCPQTSSYNGSDTFYRLCSISPRGLICFYGIDDDDRAAKIWNPSTGEHIEVNRPPLTKRCSLFLGFDPVSKKHKLLSSSNGKNYVFTLGENKWSKMEDGSSNLIPILGRNCCIDDIVYYLARRYQNDDDDDDNELVLVRFDVGSEKFLEPIHLPGDMVRFPYDDSCYSSGIYVYRGMILLLNYDSVRTNGFQMWVLEWNKWSPKRLIPWEPPSLGIYYSVGFIDREELLFYSSDFDPNSDKDFRLCSYDLEKGRWAETTFPEFRIKLNGSARYLVKLYSYVDTLESLKSFSIVQEAEEKDKS